jgi:hypothetical protein
MALPAGSMSSPHTHRTGLRGWTLPQITSAIESVWTRRSTTNIVASRWRFFFIPAKSLARGLCHNPIMPTRSSKPRDHDFTTVARRVVEQAIGEKLDGTPLDDPNAGKNPAAVALGKLGGAEGGGTFSSEAEDDCEEGGGSLEAAVPQLGWMSATASPSSLVTRKSRRDQESHQKSAIVSDQRNCMQHGARRDQ